MAKHKVEITGLDTSKIKVLSNDETKKLLKESQKGSKEARDKLVEGNLKLVLSVIRKFKDRNENLDDLFQIGCIGLMKAIDNFDLAQDVYFSTYAVPMIIGEIKRYLRDNTQLRVSRQLKDLAYKALKEKEKYLNEKQKEPTVEELAKILDVDVYDLIEALDSTMTLTSIYDPIYSDNGDTILLLDQIRDEKDEYEKTINQITLKEGVKHLDNVQKDIIFQRYYDGKTQMEIAKEYNISQAQVSRIEKNALKILKMFF